MSADSHFGRIRHRHFICFLFSFETVFVLYLFAGIYKADPRFDWFPVDITAFFFGLSTIIGAWILVRRGGRFSRQAVYIVGAALCFVIYVLFSILWSPGSIYTYEKAAYISTLTLWPLLATSLIVATDIYRLRKFMVMIVIFSIWISIEVIFSFWPSDDDLVREIYSGDRIGVGRVTGLAAIIVLVFWLFNDKTRVVTWLWFILFALFMLIQLIGGGRGPIIATFISLILPFVIGCRLSKTHVVSFQRFLLFLLSGLLLMLVITVPFVLVAESSTTITRFLLLFTEPGGGENVSFRIQAYKYALILWQESPIWGNGIGSFFTLSDVAKAFSFKYPHNIILEIMAELGIIGLLLFIILLIVSFRALKLGRLAEEPNRLLVMMLFINTFVNALVTGDISDNRYMFAMLGLMAIRNARAA